MKQIDKVVVNSGIGRLSGQPNFKDKILPGVEADFSAITGQKPMARPSKKSIAGFKLREGVIVGLKATLRHRRMESFLNKIVKVVLPRVRDFHGISPKNVDGQGNLTFGIKDHLVFPETSAEAAKANFGIQVTIVPKVEKSHADALKFYKELGIPFEKVKAKK